MSENDFEIYITSSYAQGIHNTATNVLRGSSKFQEQSSRHTSTAPGNQVGPMWKSFHRSGRSVRKTVAAKYEASAGNMVAEGVDKFGASANSSIVYQSHTYQGNTTFTAQIDVRNEIFHRRRGRNTNEISLKARRLLGTHS